MARLDDIDLESLNDEQRRAAQDILDGPRGSLSGPFWPWLRSPELADRAQRLGEFSRFHSSVPPRLKELAILYTARHWSAQFEWWAHAPMALEAGLDAEIIEALRRRERPAFSRDDEVAVYDFCAELYESKRVGDAIYQEAERHLGKQGLVELVGILGYYALVSMTLNVYEVAIPDGGAPPFGEK